jgi:uracil-DNA glycosylase
LIDALVQIKPPLHTVNPYGDAFGAVRRQNLRLYGEWLLAQRPSVLLLGEAVGYRGGRSTGVPFVSEQILLEHPLFGAERGYVKTAESPTIAREATATLMWQTLDACEVYPALWNVFPFHPHRPGQLASNRKPTLTELDLGEPFVRQLLALLPIRTIVAVGNVAEMALQRWGLACIKVRHPSHGGKRPFQTGLTAVLDGHRRFC